MSIAAIREALLAVHRRHTKIKDPASNEKSDMCEMWSMSNPPDILIESRPADDLGAAFNYNFDEMQLVAIYDMTVAQAAAYVNALLCDCRVRSAQQADSGGRLRRR